MNGRTLFAAIALMGIASAHAGARADGKVLMNPDPAIKQIEEQWGFADAVVSGDRIYLSGVVAGMREGETDLTAAYKRAFDRIFPELARRHHLPLYPFFLEGVAMDPELNQADGLHPNERGVAVLVTRIAPVVAGLIRGSS